MNSAENLYLQGLKLSIDTLALEVAKQREAAAVRNYYDGLPEWLDLEQCLSLKRGLKSARKRAADGEAGSDDASPTGGASMTFYRQKPFLQPCCGLHHKLIGGRRYWHKDDVIKWLNVTDEDLKEYTKKYSVRLPSTYEKRGV